MDLQKTKIYLDKLNREFARLNKDPENIVRIDVDIMASYVRELYDALLSDETARHEPAHSPRKPAAARPAAIEPPPTFVPPPPPAFVPPPPPVYEDRPASPPVYEMPVPAEPPPPVAVEIPAPPPPAPAKTHTTRHHHHTEAEVLFEEKQAKELSEKLAEQPIADLKKAIALNDRLLLTRELFAGDGKAFEAAIHALNGFSHIDEAKAYLIEHCVTRYMWLDKKRMEEAKKFVKLVRRRYK